MDKETRRVLAAAIDQGFRVRITRRGHAFVTKDGQPVTTFSGTPGSRGSLLRGLSQLKRAGFHWPITETD